MNLEEQVINLAAMSYRVDPATITPQTDIRKELSVKSIMMLGFISAIENELDVSIPMSKANSLNTVQDFIDEIALQQA